MAAPIGNKNARKAKDWENALRRVLVQYTNDNVPQGEALAVIAKVCVEQAMAGDKDARNEIANRLDGKPAQIVIGDADEDPVQVSAIAIKLVSPGGT
jgi:hypothetical protein